MSSNRKDPLDALAESSENAQRVRSVEKGFGPAGQPLLMPNRVLIGEGKLEKVCRKGEKPRMFFLFNDILVYGNIVVEKKVYSRQRLITIEDIEIRDLEGEKARHGWEIHSPKKSFVVYAATAEEKKEWIKHITNMKERVLRLRGSGLSGQKDTAAVWVPDSKTAVCMHCRKNKFNVINRRHHCRKCGLVVCNDCSNKRFAIPTIKKTKPVRVCLTCYHSLSHKQFEDAIKSEDHHEYYSSESESSDDDEPANSGDQMRQSTDSEPVFYATPSTMMKLD